MQTQTVTIRCKDGLNCNDVIYLIQKANEFKSQIKLEYQNISVNAKSLLSVGSLNINQETQLTVSADGPDETEAVKSLSDFLSALRSGKKETIL